VTADLSHLKRSFIWMAVGDALLLIAAAACAVAYFIHGLGWALWGLLGFIAAAFGLQLWFVRGVARAAKGG
jgi:hypothetical protein